MLVIPAMDIIEGNVVRLQKGAFDSKKEYSKTPLDIAKTFEEAGLKHLHLVDLDGAKEGEVKNLKTLELIKKNTSLKIDFGGGVKSLSSLISTLNAGADEVSVGSIAVKKEDEVLSWLTKYSDKLILSADALNNYVAVSGWQENTDINVFDFISSYYEKGIKKVISTDISRDGMLSGPSFTLYQEITKRVPKIKVIASGGIRNKEDLLKLSSMNLYGAIVGKAYYENYISLEEMVEIENA